MRQKQHYNKYPRERKEIERQKQELKKQRETLFDYLKLFQIYLSSTLLSENVLTQTTIGKIRKRGETRPHEEREKGKHK